MPLLKVRLEKEITTEEAERLAKVIRVFAADVPEPYTDDDLGALVSGVVAGHIDKMLGSPRVPGFVQNGWTFK